MTERNVHAQVSIEDLLTGSKQHWNDFVDCYSRLIFKTFHAPSFGFTKEDVDDLFHDFMVLMIKDDFRKLRLYEGRNNCSLASYLRKIAVNLAIDRRKRMNRLRSLSLNRPLKIGSEEELGDLVEGPEGEPMEPLESEEDRLRYLWALYRLDVPKFLVTVLIIYHDLDRERIATIMNTTRQNVDVLFKRGKDRMIDLVSGKKSGQALKIKLLEWDPAIIQNRNQIAVMERKQFLEKCLECLDVPDELLVGLLFANTAILEPTPDRLAALFKSNPEEESVRVKEVFAKLGLK